MKLWASLLAAAAVTLALGLELGRRSAPERRQAWNVHLLTGKLHIKKLLA